MNNSILQTLPRSINTSLTLIFAILALMLMGGEGIREFLWAMLIGTVVGAYSSIFFAAQVLVSWEEGDIPRLFRRMFGRREHPADAEAEARRRPRKARDGPWHVVVDAQPDDPYFRKRIVVLA